MIVAIFKRVLKPEVSEAYASHNRALAKYESEIDGFIKSESIVDGLCGWTMYYFASEAALRAWQIHPQHLQAKKMAGRYYQSFSVEILNNHATTMPKKS